MSGQIIAELTQFVVVKLPADTKSSNAFQFAVYDFYGWEYLAFYQVVSSPIISAAALIFCAIAVITGTVTEFPAIRYRWVFA